MISIPTEFFISFFKPSIRVLFNWDRMEHERWTTELIAVDNSLVLSSWYVPWYVGSSGQEVNYQAPDATPIALSDILGIFPCLNKDRAQAISELARSFRNDRQPIQLVVPVYALDQAQYLLLDGNHRMAALATSQVEFSLMAFVVYGPLDEQVLPDIQAWNRRNSHA